MPSVRFYPLVGLLNNPVVPSVIACAPDLVEYLDVIPDRLWYDFEFGEAEGKRFRRVTGAIEELKQCAVGRVLGGHCIGLSGQGRGVRLIDRSLLLALPDGKTRSSQILHTRPILDHPVGVEVLILRMPFALNPELIFMKTVRLVLALLALSLMAPLQSAKAADVICYNCPPEWADWASMAQARPRIPASATGLPSAPAQAYQLAFARSSSSGEFRYIPDMVSTQHRWS